MKHVCYEGPVELSILLLALLYSHRQDRDRARALLAPGRFIEVYMKVRGDFGHRTAANHGRTLGNEGHKLTGQPSWSSPGLNRHVYCSEDLPLHGSQG